MKIHRVVHAIREQIVAQRRTIRTDICCVVRIDEPTDGRIVIPALEVIEPSLFEIPGFSPKLSSAQQTGKTEPNIGTQG